MSSTLFSALTVIFPTLDSSNTRPPRPALLSRKLGGFSLLLALATGPANQAAAQCSATSTDGYTVHVRLEPTDIIPSTMACEWGYNYNLRFNYSVSFSGSNIPAALYTLQATFTCAVPGDANFASLPLNGGSGTLITGSNPYRPDSDCATATVASLDCNHVSVFIQGPGLSTTISCPYYTPLPVTLTRFDAVAQLNGLVALRWATALEKNSRDFTVERSYDASSWETVRQVPAAGSSNSPRNYHVLVEAPSQALAYYRLRQTDFDGASSFSPVVTVKPELAPLINLFPNPNQTNQLEISGLAVPGEWELVLRDPSTRPRFQTQLTRAQLTLPPLPAGVYLVELRHLPTGRKLTLKYLK
jgi:hypothetical protein